MVYNYLSLKCFPIFLKYYFQVFFDGQNNSKYRDVSRLKAVIITQLIPDVKFTSSFSTIQSYQLFFLVKIIYSVDIPWILGYYVS